MSKDETPEPEVAEEPSEGAEIRRVNIGLHVAAQIFLAVLLFILANYLSYRHHGQKDLTEDKRYTVDENTARYISNLNQDVNITLAFSKGSKIYPQLDALLDQYEELSGGRVKVERFDPGREKSRALAFSDEKKIPLKGNQVILDFNGRKKVITEAEMLAEDGRLFFGEDVITSRIIGATQGGDQKVYFLASYGGLELVKGRTALDQLKALAGLQFANVEMLSLADVNEIPYDADALVLLNPDKDLEPRDVDLIQEYWEGRGEGGSILVMLNPATDTPRLDRFIDRLGVTRRDDRVLHTINSVVNPRPEFRVQGRFLAGSPITKNGLTGTVTTFNGMTCSLEIASDDPELTQEGIRALPLVEATDRFWGETRYDTGEVPVFDASEDRAAPLYVAASVERGGIQDAPVRGDASRMVVVANGTLLDPDTASGANVDFFLSSLNWALDREELIGITPKRATTYSIEMDEKQTKRTFWLAVILLPGLVFGAAAMMWRVRRA